MTQGPKEWNGVSNPRTAGGGSALVEPTPHHIACDALHVTFRADAERIESFLPPGMEPVPECTGWVMIADMVKISAEDPDQFWRNPERSNYNECVLGFNVTFQGRTGRYSPLIWVNRDWSLGMGQIMGWGKRLAMVERSRLINSRPIIDHVGPGARIGGIVHRNGNTIIRASVEIEDDAKPLDALPSYGSTTFLYRYLASPGPGIPEVSQLLELHLTNVAMSDIWRGRPSLSFSPGDNEELELLGEIEIGEGFVYRRGWTLDRQAKLVHDYTLPAQMAAE